MNVVFWRLWKEVGCLLKHLPDDTEKEHKEPRSEFCDDLEC
jgi:hypothetical protein